MTGRGRLMSDIDKIMKALENLSSDYESDLSKNSSLSERKIMMCLLPHLILTFLVLILLLRLTKKLKSVKCDHNSPRTSTHPVNVSPGPSNSTVDKQDSDYICPLVV